MNMALRIGSMACIFSMVVGIGFGAASRARANSEPSKSMVIGSPGCRASSWGSDRKATSPLARHVFSSRTFNRAALQDPSQFIAQMEEVFEDEDDFVAKLRLHAIPALFFEKYMLIPSSPDDTADGAAVVEVSASGVLLVWQYLFQEGLFRAIKEKIVAMNAEMRSATDIGLLGTSVSSGLGMMCDHDDVQDRNAAIVEFIDAMEKKVQAILNVQAEAAAVAAVVSESDDV